MEKSARRSARTSTPGRGEAAVTLKVVVAPQAFKGSIDGSRVADAIARGVRQVFPHAEIVLLPVADGGEGTVDALVRSCRGTIVTSLVLGPLEEPVNAAWG